MKNFFKFAGFCALALSVAGFASCEKPGDAASVPTNLRATIDSDHAEVTLAWNKVDGATGYEVMLSTETTPHKTSQTSYVIKNIVWETEYEWQVRAINSAGKPGVWVYHKFMAESAKYEWDYFDLIGNYGATGEPFLNKLYEKVPGPASWTGRIVQPHIDNEPLFDSYMIRGMYGEDPETFYILLNAEPDGNGGVRLFIDDEYLLAIAQVEVGDGQLLPAELIAGGVYVDVIDGYPEFVPEGENALEVIWDPKTRTLIFPNQYAGRALASGIFAHAYSGTTYVGTEYYTDFYRNVVIQLQ